MSNLVYGNVKHPPFVDRLIPDNENWAWDNLGPRKWQIGVVQHTMVGTLWGTDSYFRRGAASTGLTDYGIGGSTDGDDDGLILRWNDPTGAAHPGVSPNRWGWASGPTNYLNGDGVAFVNRYGSNAVNGYLVSIERSDGGNPDIPASNRYIDSFIGLASYWADQNKIPYDEYPYNPQRGVMAYYWHSEFTNKSCPAGAKASTDEIQAEVAARLKAAQTSDVDGEEDILAELPKSDYTLDPDLIWTPDASTGAVGQLWRDYGEKTGIFNPPGQPWNDDVGGGYKIYCFEGGPVIAVHNGEAAIVVKVAQ